MLKLVLIGLWVILVTAGATVASSYLAGKGGDTPAAASDTNPVEELKSDMMSIPVIRNGGIVGYVIIQLTYAADKVLLDERKIEPTPYLNDAAFRAIFTASEVDYQRLRTEDLDRLTSAIGTEANKRFGREVVKQVLIQQLNFVRKEEIRTNWIGRNSN